MITDTIRKGDTIQIYYPKAQRVDLMVYYNSMTRLAIYNLITCPSYCKFFKNRIFRAKTILSEKTVKEIKDFLW
jgi:hypothetical protein